MPPLILASQSPRRKQLLEQAHYSFSVKTSTMEEFIEEGQTPVSAVEQISKQKAHNIWSHHQDAVVIGADTIVVYEDMILGKPKNEEDARRTLKLLAGRVHHVYTGVTIYSKAEVLTFHERTTVEFYPLDEKEISFYIQSGEPFDKAGSYGIQGFGAYFVKKIEGDYFNVVGLPIAKTVRALMQIGLYPSFNN